MPDSNQKDFLKTAHVLIQKAQKRAYRNKRSIFLNAGLLSVYGFQMVVPVLLGIFIGRFLDKNFPATSFSWTLNFILLGFILGFINAYKWSTREGVIKKKGKDLS